MLRAGPAAAAAAAALLALAGPAHPAPAADGGPALAFVPNLGQWSAEVRFQARAGDTTLFFTDRELVAVRGAGPEPVVERLALAGPAGSPPTAGRRLPGVLHFFRGGPERWRRQVPRFAELLYADARPGVDLRFSGAGGALRLAVEPAPGAGAMVARRLRADLARLGPVLDLPAPVDAGGPAAAPALAYSTYLGGTFGETARDIAVDGAGHAYLAGTTSSHNFPTRAAFQDRMGNTGQIQDAFVSKLEPDGRGLVWSSFLGGARLDEATGVAVDAAGQVYVTGYTTAEDFPLANPVQDAIHKAADPFSGEAFVSLLSAAGDQLLFSSYLGGTSRDLPRAITVDAGGFFYITGATGSHFPAVNALQPLNRGIRDVFIAKFRPAGAGLVYSTHLGGTDRDEGWAIAADAAGNAYVTGFTRSRNFPVGRGPLQRAFGGAQDAFVARINAEGSALDYATYFGGRSADEGTGIAVTPEGEAVFFGHTASTGLPRVAALQPAPNGPSDQFLARLTATGDRLRFSTYLGGGGAEGDCLIPAVDPGLDPEGGKLVPEWVGDVALDSLGRIYLAGCTTSPNFPLRDPIQATRSGAADGFVSALEGDGSAVLFSTLVGGTGLDAARGVAVDGEGAVYAAGQSSSADFPVVRALQPSRSGVEDAFALKIAPVLAWPPTATPSPPPTTTPPEPTPSPRPSLSPEPSATPSVPPTEAPPTMLPPTPTAAAPPPLMLPIAWRPAPADAPMVRPWTAAGTGSRASIRVAAGTIPAAMAAAPAAGAPCCCRCGRR